MEQGKGVAGRGRRGRVESQWGGARGGGCEARAARGVGGALRREGKKMPFKKYVFCFARAPLLVYVAALAAQLGRASILG